ncbi:MAG: VIT1/CCC1 transporter family protein [Candidatus Binatia bacterium]
MPATPHHERHFTATAAVRDVVIGMADGLTVPFALAAGLSGAVDSTAVIVTAGLAEIAAGAIAMGLGGYQAARTDAEHYATELAREERETREVPRVEVEEVASVFRRYGLADAQIRPVLDVITADRRRWVDFMMRFELGLDAPDPTRARRSALTIAAAYVAGGLIPLLPYVAVEHVATALQISVAVTLVALFVFGVVKSRFTGMAPLRGGLQTLGTGGLAAAAAFTIARWIA